MKGKPMRKALVFFKGIPAGYLIEEERSGEYVFLYNPDYDGPGISLTMPAERREYHFKGFPPFFDGLLPEGFQLEGLLKQKKIDRDDNFSQLITVGSDLVGAVTVVEEKE